MICFLLWTTVNARLYSNTSMKSSIKVSFPCLSPFLILFHFTWISISFTSVLRVILYLYLGPRSTQDYSTISMKSSGKLFCSYLFSFPFFFIYSSEYLSPLPRYSEWILHLVLRTTINSGLQHHYNKELWWAVLPLPFSVLIFLPDYLSRLLQFWT